MLKYGWVDCRLKSGPTIHSSTKKLDFPYETFQLLISNESEPFFRKTEQLTIPKIHLMLCSMSPERNEMFVDSPVNN